jgi:hypothetical protein
MRHSYVLVTVYKYKYFLLLEEKSNTVWIFLTDKLKGTQKQWLWWFYSNAVFYADKNVDLFLL